MSCFTALHFMRNVYNRDRAAGTSFVDPDPLGLIAIESQQSCRQSNIGSSSAQLKGSLQKQERGDAIFSCMV